MNTVNNNQRILFLYIIFSTTSDLSSFANEDQESILGEPLRDNPVSMMAINAAPLITFQKLAQLDGVLTEVLKWAGLSELLATLGALQFAEKVAVSILSLVLRQVVEERIHVYVSTSEFGGVKQLCDHYMLKNEDIGCFVVFAVGCMASSENDPISEHMCGAMRREGIKISLRTMKALPNVPCVQCWGFRALRECASGICDGMCPRFVLGVPRSVKLLIDEGGIDVIVKSMKQHLQVAAVQESSYRTLCSLAVASDSIIGQEIASAGGISTILEGMRAHLSVASVQQSGCAALCIISVRDRCQCKSAIVAAGGIETIIEGMQENQGSEDVQTQGTNALCTLAHDKDDVLRVRKAILRGIATILSGMRGHLHANVLQSRGCEALRLAIVGNPRRRKIAAAAGCFKVANAILQKYDKSTSASRAARALLKELMIE